MAQITRCAQSDHPSLSSSYTSPQILQSNVFCLALYLVSTIPTLPLQVYQTFVIEEKHGFNKTYTSLFVTDMLKSWALVVVLGGPFLSAFLYIFEWAGDRFLPWLLAFM